MMDIIYEHRVIRTAVEMREQGLSLRQIALILSQIGVPTKQRGKAWHPEMKKRLLTGTALPALVVRSRDR